MIKLKKLLKESTWVNRKFGDPLPTMADYKKSHESKKEKKLKEGKVNQSKVNSAFTRGVASIRKISKSLNDDDNYAFIQKLEKWLK